MSRIKKIRLQKNRKDRHQEGVNSQEISFLLGAFSHEDSCQKKKPDTVQHAPATKRV